MASLYVGDLHPDVSEAMLFEKFSTAGPVLSIRVCRDLMTRRSLGYAYVNFQQPADAERALDTMNFDTIKGRPIRIMWSQRDPSLRKSGVGNIFIKNLDKKIENKSLYDTMSAFGTILSCKIATDENGSRGYGFVHYETEDQARAAIDKVNGMMMHEKKVFVGKFMSRRERIEQLGDKSKTYNNIYIKHLKPDVDDNGLQELFAKFGEIVSAKVMVDDKGTSKGFGFVCFKEPHSAQDAVTDMNEKDVGGSAPLYVARAQLKAERQAELRDRYERKKLEMMNRYQGVNLYVKNLDDIIDDQRLRNEFAKFGTITSAKVMRDSQTNSRGFGFVCFSSPEEATKAVTEMNGRIIATKPLYVALAQRKDERLAHLQAQHLHKLNIRHNMAAPMPYASSAGYYMQSVPQQRPYYQQNGVAPIRAQRYPQVGSMQRYAGPGNVQANQGNRAASTNARPITGGQQPGTVAIQPGADSRIASAPAGQMHTGVAPPRGPQQVQTRAQQFPYGRVGTRAPNAMPQSVPAPNQGAPQQAVHVPGQAPLTSAMLTSAKPHEQKQMLGERLYPIIHQFYGDLAGKITGMLLEIDNAELLHMLEQRDSLRAKADEAVQVLQAHQAKEIANKSGEPKLA